VDDERALLQALARQELVLHYQPQVALTDGRILGVEALLRWQHPEYGAILPETFIPLAEKTGLIMPIGEWVLRKACAQVRTWHDQGFTDLRVAINLSGRQLERPGLATMVQGVLIETGLAPRALELEITETHLIRDHNADEAVATMRELQALGVAFVIDDFGTGYASLTYLKRFPFRALKIDKSFVQDLGASPHDAVIVCATIAMTCALGIRVIAEGVETAAQAAFLRTHGCASAQGHYFARPESANDMTERLRRQALASGQPSPPLPPAADRINGIPPIRTYPNT
jgi:EAL domain-containing protein (putative c-di-GMP-specific phosphodiesterase class I)